MSTTDEDELWSPQRAARETGLHEETIRSWTRGENSIIRRVDQKVGRRRLVRVYRSEVLREAAKRGIEAGTAPARPRTTPADVSQSHDELDRLATLEEVARRRRAIDECREEIEQLHRAIIAHQREIEVILLGPSRIPNE